MAKSGRSQDALQQLLEERKRYEQWLATLESKRDSTPEHVYKRVHADYEARLGAVRDQLTERTSEIRSAVTGLKDRLKQTTEQESARVDELHEAELRATVGEFTPEQWELRRREVEVDLKQFADEKRTISSELDQLLLILGQTTGDGEPPAPEASPSRAQAPQPAAPVAPDATRVSRKTPARSRAATPPAPPPPAEEEKATVAIESLAPADGLPAKVPEPSSAPAEPAPAEAKSDTRSSQPAKSGKKSAFAPAEPDSRRENEKTLKCGECGAMNYPTEWYCESCGGELSAL